MSQTQKKQDRVNPSEPTPASGGLLPEIREAQEQLKHFRGIPVDISIELGRGKLKLRDLLGLRYHSVFELDQPAGASMDIYVNGILLARGVPVVHEDHVGIMINEIVELEG